MDSAPKQMYLKILEEEYGNVMDVNSLFRWKESKTHS